MSEQLPLRAPVLRRLYRDWQSRRHGRLPRRADFDPADFGYILGNMSLIEVCREPLRFRFRVHGTSLAAETGIELTGKFVDEAAGIEFARIAERHYRDVLDHECPSVAHHVGRRDGAIIWEAEALTLPLSQNGETVDFLLAAVVHHRRAIGFQTMQAETHLVRLPPDLPAWRRLEN